MEARKKFYQFQSSDESSSESSDEELLCSYLIYPEESSEEELVPLQTHPIENSFNDLQLQTGDGVVTRRQAAAATQGKSPIPASNTDKKKTSAKLKAKNGVKTLSKLSEQEPPNPASENEPTSAVIPLESAAAAIPANHRASASPQPGPSGITKPNLSQQQAEPSALPRQDENADVESEIETQSLLTSTNFFAQETKVFENEDFVLLMQKVDHQRQKVYYLLKHVQIKYSIFL